MMSLPLDLLQDILRRCVVAFEPSHPFQSLFERQFLALESNSFPMDQDTRIALMSNVYLGVDGTRVLQYALVCVAFWRALKRIREAKWAVFSRVVRVASVGENHDGDREPYFATRWGSGPRGSLKGEQDVAGGIRSQMLWKHKVSLPDVRCVEIGGRGVTVALLPDGAASNDVVQEAQAFLLWYDWHGGDPVPGLIKEAKRILLLKKWKYLKNSAVVTNDPWRTASDHVNVKKAEAQALSWRIPHFVLHFGNSNKLIEGTNVEECMTTVTSAVLAEDAPGWVVVPIVCAKSTKKTKFDERKCGLM